MKAIQFEQFGAPDVLKLADMPMPECGSQQVLVKVHAAGLNPIDYKTRNGSGFVAQLLKDHLPSGLGYDFAGEVAEVGSEVHEFEVGDKVMGFVGFDHPCAYAGYLCASPGALIKMPETLSFINAAALPTAGLTALQALNQANVKQNDVVLIHAGSGGVGHLAIQLAKQKGATVITTASAKNHDFLKALGADQCIDYRNEDVASAITQPVDAVIDLVGGQAGIESVGYLTQEGCIVTVPTVTADAVIAAAKQQHRQAFGLLKQPNMAELAYLAKLASQEQLKVEISQVFSLNEAVRAHEILETGHVRGKLVFEVNG
tara:strand:+ start:21804 stop:22751 length:948 start_codon:yes stop_codon:yes gene_type:complete